MFIAKNLRRLRLYMRLTQEEHAARVGVTGQAVSKWERDECYPDITLLPGLANCFGVTVDELLGMYRTLMDPTEAAKKISGFLGRTNASQ